MIGAFLEEFTSNTNKNTHDLLPINLALIEIYPQVQESDHSNAALSPLLIKIQLQTCTNLKICISQDDHDGLLNGLVHLSDSTTCNKYIDVPIGSDPISAIQYIPCKVVGYAVYNRNEIRNKNDKIYNCFVSEGTMVRIIHSPNRSISNSSLEWYQRELLIQKEECSTVIEQNDAFIVSCHEDSTVSTMVFRMEMLLRRENLVIGTTEDAFRIREKRISMSGRIRSIASQLSSTPPSLEKNGNNQSTTICNTNTTNKIDKTNNLLIERGLILWNSTHASGKTSLIKAIARSILQCPNIYTIHPGMLFSIYGTNQADVAFQSILHSISLSAAARKERICIILDNIDGFLPSIRNSGDPSSSALNAIAAYLSKVTHSLQSKSQFPFPTNNPLYNCHSKHGFLLPLNICIVGVVTCHESYALKNVLGEEVFVPIQLSATARVRAFHMALKKWNIKLQDNEAEYELQQVAALSVSAYGTFFDQFGRTLRDILHSKQDGDSNHDTHPTYTLLATTQHIQTCITLIKQQKSNSSSSSIQEVMISSTAAAQKKTPKEMIQEKVGGNTKAKIALLDALALDMKQQRRLLAFGLHPPLGILLYGPPGTGKTLLAKTTAQILSSTSTNNIGGTFLSLKANEIITNTIGTSEKIITQTFEAAKTNTPCVIFIDEFQALFISRESGGGSRLATTLLQCMDDIKHWSDVDQEVVGGVGNNRNRIVVFAATNVPWMVDKAFLRTGRFDRVVYVGLPNLQERSEILYVYVHSMKLSYPTGSSDTSREQFIQTLCKTIAMDCEGFSGADLYALCRAAATRCLSYSDGDGMKELHFREAILYDVRKSCEEDVVARIHRWRP